MRELGCSRAVVSRKAIICTVALLAIGCVKAVTIVPIDGEHNVLMTARVSADGHDVGIGVSRVEVHDGAAQVTIENGPEWLPATSRLDERSPDRVEVLVRPDGLYLNTVADENRVVNQWLSLNIAPSRHSTYWTSVITAITGGDFEMEIMDASSGFMRTAWREVTYGTRHMRRRFVGNIVTQQPLVWRLKYEVQRSDDGSNWEEYDRAVADDLRIITEIRGRSEQ
jgi:hypothetical protein